jgi:imidazolonepropionase-like amidohydrolase
MRRLALVSTVLALLLSGSPPFEARAETLAVVGGTLVDGTGGPAVPDAVVVAEDGRIACAGPRSSCPVPDGARIVDAAGRWVTPGLVDAHVHFSQTGWADGRPDAFDLRERYPYEETVAALQEHPERFFRSWLCSGVTAVFDVGGYPWTFDMAQETAGNPEAPRVVAAGPLLSTLDFWLNLPAERQFIHLGTPEGARAGVRYLAARGAGAVKVWFIVTGERPMEEMAAAVRAAGEAAREAGLPLIVHATGLAEAKEALRAGADVLVHGVDDRPVDAEFLELAKAAGTVYTPTLTVVSGYWRMFRSAATGEPPAIDDPNGCVDPETRAKVLSTAEYGDAARERGLTAEWADQRIEAHREERKITDANLLAVHRAGVPVAMGTDAGNPLTLHGPSVHAELEAMEAAGMTPAEVLVAATRNGARAMGLPDERGTVEAGKVADLLVLAEDPTASASAFRSLLWVIRAGEAHRAEDLAYGE